MHHRRLQPLAGLLLLLSALTVVAGSRASAADPGVLLRTGDRLTAAIGDRDGDEDVFDFDAAEGGAVRIDVAAARRSELVPTVQVLRPDGVELPAGPPVEDHGSPRSVVRQFKIPDGQTGRWQLRVAGEAGTTGRYTVRARILPPPPVRELRVTVPANGEVVIPFVGGDGAMASYRIRRLSGAAPADVRLTDPAARDVPGAGTPLKVNVKVGAPRSVRARLALTQGFGVYGLVLVGATDGDSVVDVLVRVRPPRVAPRRTTLPAEPRIDALTTTVLRQEDEGLEVTVLGGNFPKGTRATVEGGGVTVTETSVTAEGSLRLVVDVAADAPYGARRLLVLPPELLGESVPVADALTVNAPDPALTAVAPAVVEQSTSGTLVVTGTGFRSGGTVATTDDGVSITGVTVVSDTELSVSYDVDPAATVSLRDVVYTQPAEGGGAVATLTGAYQAMPHGPVLATVTPATLAPGSSHVVVRVTGTWFDAGMSAAFAGTGVTVHTTRFVDAGTADIDLSVAPDAAIGRRGLTLTGGPDGGPPHAFDDAVVVAAPDAVVRAFSHGSVARGAAAASVTVSGRNFRAGDTLAASGQGVSFSDVTVATGETITAKLSVDAAAATGPRDLTVTRAAADGGRSATLLDAFRVVAAVPSVSGVNPSAIGVTGAGGPAREVQIEIDGANFMTGATATVTRAGGAGLTIVGGSTQVVSDTRIALTLSVGGTATTGAWDVTVSNPAGLGTATAGGALTVRDASTLAVNRVLASSGSTYGGERVTVEGSGFVNGCTVDFGSVRASGTQVLDASTLVTTVPSPAAASVSAATVVDVKVTTPGGGTATLRRGYGYAKDTARFVTVATVPAQGATSVARNLVSAVVVLSSPLDPATGVYGTTTGLNTFWYESGGGFTAGGFRGVGPGGRFLVLSRSGGGSLAIGATGTYVLDVPTALKSVGGSVFAPTRLVASANHDQQTFAVSQTALDTTAPTLSTISPANGSTGQDPATKVVLRFSEPLDPLTVGPSTVALKLAGTAVPAALSLSDDLRTVTLTPENELLTSTTYTVSVTATVADLCANAFAPVTQTFTTSNGTDGTAPTVDAVVLESLPASVDGSGTYVGAGGASGQAFDLYLPRWGWSIDVTFSDAGGAGVDPSKFSAKCSAAVGSNAANAELAANFTVTGAGASWRIPSTSPVAAGGNVTFTFTVADRAGNVSSGRTITVDVADKDSTAAGSGGGDLDPFDARRTWILRTDLDSFTSSHSTRTSPAAEQGVTTTVAANGVPDLDEALLFVGLGSANMTAAAAATTNGLDTGTNAIVQRLFVERVRELLNERYGIDADGTHGADSVDVEFLLPGEQGSLATAPTYSASGTSNSQKPFSEMSVGGTLGAESNAWATPGTLGEGAFDARNRREEANLNGGRSSDSGVFLLSALKAQVNSNALFMAKVSSRFVKIHGGTPVGEDASDDDVLAGSFRRITSTNTTLNARYDAILDAVEVAALYTSVIAAHEIGHSLGLVADGAPKTGLFGGAHYGNTFTEATSVAPNTSQHLDFLGNDLMAASTSFDSATLTGSDFKRFTRMDLAYLLDRLVYDEGR